MALGNSWSLGVLKTKRGAGEFQHQSQTDAQKPTRFKVKKSTEARDKKQTNIVTRADRVWEESPSLAKFFLPFLVSLLWNLLRRTSLGS